MAINPEFQPSHFDQGDKQRRLEDDFHFSLDGHELINPETNRGYVESITELEPISEQGEVLPVRLYEVAVKDPFVAADQKGYEIVNAYIAGIEQEMLRDGFDLLNDRTEATSRRKQNDYTNAWLADPKVESLQIWRDLVPTAQALGYLTNPEINSIVSNRKGDAAIMTPETAAHLRFVDDAIGIRDRGVAFEQLGVDHLSGFERGSDVRWLSLASGTAEPSILAAKRASEAHGVEVELTVADYDADSLKFVQTNAAKAGFKGEINTLHHNILDEQLADTLKTATGKESQYDVVEAMGFEEYLPQVGDELGAYKGKMLPQASVFTKRAWDMVKPGGVLMSGNMVLSQREQLAFVFGIVDWPIINARSEKSILRVYQEAGIVDDPSAQIEMYRIKDATSGTHVYNIVKVSKKA